MACLPRMSSGGGRLPRARQGIAIAILAGALVHASCAARTPTLVEPSSNPAYSDGPITTRELVELKLISVVSVAPDQRLAVARVDAQYVDDASTRLTWHVLDLESGAVKARFDAGAPLWSGNHFIAGEAPHWSLDSQWIYFRKLVGEQVQVWRARADGTEISQVTHEAANVVGLEMQADGSLIYAVDGATRQAVLDAEAVEYDQGVLLTDRIITGFPISKSFPSNGRMASHRHIGRAGSGRRGSLLGELPLRVMRLDQPDGAAVSVTGDEAVAFLSRRQLEPGFGYWSGIANLAPPSLANGPLTAAVEDGATSKSHVTTRSGRLVSWRRQGEEAVATWCAHPFCLEADDIAIVGWRADSTDLVLKATGRGVTRLGVWNVAHNSLRTIFERGGVIGSAESGEVGQCQLARDSAVCIAAAGDSPPKVISIDLATGSVRTILDPNPRITPERLGLASVIELVDGAGNATLGIVITPRHRPPQTMPLVITSYTCRGFLQGGSGRDVPEHVLASLGYVSVCVDLGSEVVRPASDFKPTTTNVNKRALGFYENAIDVLAKAGIADRDRVALAGFSGSATAASFAITQSPAFTAAIVTTRGSADALLCYLAAHYRSCDEAAKREGFAPPYDRRDGYLHDSPAWNADKATAPLLMQLPEAEYTGMMQLYGALDHYERAVEMYVFPEAYHYKHHPRQRLAVYDRNVEWINFWLKGEKPSAAAGQGTALRWQAMRSRQCKHTSGDALHDHAMWYCNTRAGP